MLDDIESCCRIVGMDQVISVGDTVAITATVRKRVTEDRVSVLIPSYGQPHSIVDQTPHISSGQKIELVGGSAPRG